MKLAPELIDAAGEAPQLVRDVESLVEHSDAERTASIFVSPRFFDASGSGLLSNAATPLRDALHRLIGADATAVALSADLHESFFLELRATPALNVPARRLAMDLNKRVGRAAADVEKVIAAGSWQPYGREVIARFPSMLGAVASNCRSGEDQKQAVVNCYLPAIAGHNLLMGTELLLTQSRSDAGSPADQPAPPQTVAERLAKKTSLSFAKDTLQRALDVLAADLGVEIQIAGRDLLAEGITKNQSFAIDLRDRPGSEILLEILRRANPDRSAASPVDPRQKLVYVVEPPAADSPGRIIVTTRAAAEKRGQTLPAEFLGKGE